MLRDTPPAVPATPSASSNRSAQPQFAQPMTIYGPESELLRPIQLLRAMGQDLLTSRELAWQLFVRDINSQYRQSLLGILWAFIPPIAAAIGLTFAKSINAINIGETDLPYPAYVMLSMTIWQTFTEAISAPMSGFDEAQALMARVKIPREATVLARLAELIFNFGIKLALIIVLFLVFRLPITWSVFLAPVALIHLISLGMGFGLLLAPLAALYSDISRILSYFLTFLLLITPVVYPLPKPGILRSLIELNPVTPLLVTTRELATTGVVTHAAGFWWSSALAVVLIVWGWLSYRLAMPYVVERMSS